MLDIPTTSYNNSQIQDQISIFVKKVNPKVSLEIGSQRGCSSVLISSSMKKDTFFYSCDLFENTYQNPPYSQTLANIDEVIANMKRFSLDCFWEIFKGDYRDLITKRNIRLIDLLHVDICNHYENLKPILLDLTGKVSKGIILEGGKENHWQKKHGYEPWGNLMNEDWFSSVWEYQTVEFNESQSVTFCLKKENN